ARYSTSGDRADLTQAKKEAASPPETFLSHGSGGDAAPFEAPGQYSGELEDQLHLDGRVERQHRDADGRAGVPARVAEDLAEQLGCAVDDAGLPREVGGGRDEADDLDDARHAVERADDVVDGGERVEGADAG